MPTRNERETKQVVAIIDAELCEQLDAICEALERSRSWVIARAIRNYVEQHEPEGARKR